MIGLNSGKLIALLLIALIILMGCILKEDENAVGEKPKTEAPKEEKIFIPEKKEEVPLTEYDKYLECQKKYLAVDKDTCVYELALELLQPYICGKIETGLFGKNLADTREQCNRQIGIKKAIALDSTEECRKLSFDFDAMTCLKEIAVNKSDLNICLEINDDKISIDCIVAVAVKEKNINFCNQIISSNIKSSCYTSVAVGALDDSLCNTHEELTKKDNCFLAVAKEKHDSSICDKIYSAQTKKYCLETA